MSWNIDFIKEKQFEDHVSKTIEKYDKKLDSYDLRKFNSNTIDPIKLIFDKMVYSSTWEEVVKNEIFRQRDKANNNDIGYFHQKIFLYIKHCTVPDDGWDVIYENQEGIILPDGDVVHKIYVEMKNKHNTLNSAAGGKTYIKMQNQLLKDDDCACFLVEAIAKQSQNIIWKTTVDKQKVSHRRIRRVSLDQFYSVVTGEENAFYKICMVLPNVIEKILKSNSDIKIPDDSAYRELKKIASTTVGKNDDISFLLAAYLLGFGTYKGFENCNISKKHIPQEQLYKIAE